MIIRELVSDVRESFKWINNDNIASDRWIASELNKEAMLLIKREVSKRKLLSSDNIFTTIPCLKMKEVALAECCDYNSSPCTIARSVDKIPNIAEGIYGLICQGVYDIKGETSFDYMDPNRYANFLKLYGKEKALKNKVFWKQNGYLYVNTPDVELLKLVAYFETQVPTTLLYCEGKAPECAKNPLDEEFKCPGFLLSDVKKMVRDTINKTYKNSVADVADDDKADSK